jgi:hypothetical protein
MVGIKVASLETGKVLFGKRRQAVASRIEYEFTLWRGARSAIT